MFNFKNTLILITVAVFTLLSGCSTTAETVQDEEFNDSLINLMEDMSTRIAEKPQNKEERLVLKYTNKSSEIQLELNPNEDDFYLDLSGISPAARDTVYIREPASGARSQNADSKEATPNSQNTEPGTGEEEGKENNTVNSGDDIRQVLSKFRRAQDLFYLEEYSEALELLNETLDIAETADAYALKGTIHFMLGNRNATRANWNRAVELNPDLPMPNIPELEDMIEEIMVER